MDAWICLRCGRFSFEPYCDHCHRFLAHSRTRRVHIPAGDGEEPAHVQIKARATLLIAQTLGWPFAFEAELGPPFARAIVDGVVWNPAQHGADAMQTNASTESRAWTREVAPDGLVDEGTLTGIAVEAFCTSPGSPQAIHDRTALLSSLGFATCWLCSQEHVLRPKTKYGEGYYTVTVLGRAIAALHTAHGSPCLFTWSADRGYGCYRLMPPQGVPRAPEALKSAVRVHHPSLDRLSSATVHAINGRYLYYPFPVPAAPAWRVTANTTRSNREAKTKRDQRA